MDVAAQIVLILWASTCTRTRYLLYFKSDLVMRWRRFVAGASKSQHLAAKLKQQKSSLLGGQSPSLRGGQSILVGASESAGQRKLPQPVSSSLLVASASSATRIVVNHSHIRRVKQEARARRRGRESFSVPKSI